MAVLQGILSVLCTPFQENGSLDKKSLIRLVEHNLSWEVDGLVCFGLASEIYKLSDRERDEMLELVVEIAAGSVPVIAGTEHSGVETAAIRSQDAARAGAAAVMLYPPTFVKLAPSQVKEYYEEISQKAGVPIIIQDAPAWTDVPLPVDLLVEIKKIAPRVEYVKVEAPPTAPKMAALLEQGLTPLGGYGALHLFEELSAGITGTMPGCSLPGLYCDLWQLHDSARRAECWELFTRALPLLSFQLGSLDLYVAVQKTLLTRIGVLSSSRLRRPGVKMTPAQIEWLDFLMEKTGMDSYLGARPQR